MDLKEIASQLRKPEGENGKLMALNMNKSNLFINQNMIDTLPLKPHHQILEIGMGNGFFVKDILAIEPTVHYIGCDFSETMVVEATEMNMEFVKNGKAGFVKSSSEKLPFADQHFDVIFTINTLYFWENPLKELEEIKRVLKNGGKLLIGIRSKKIMSTLPFTAFGFQLYEKSDAEGLLQKSGFKNIEIIEKEEPAQEIGGHQVKMDTLILTGEK